MAEVLGTVASAIAVVQAAGALITLSQQIISVAQTVKNAPEGIQAITDRIGVLETILKKLKDTADAADLSDDSADGLADLCAPKGPLDNCRKCLEKLADLLPSTSVTSDKKHGISKTLSKLKLGAKWSFKSSEVKALLDDVDHHQTDIQSRLAIATHNHVRKTKKSVYSIHDTLKDNERREYYRWLEKNYKDYDEIQRKWTATREKDTCTWILKEDKWQKWLSGETASRLLWINGIMGTGKTILMSFVVDHFKKLHQQGHKTAMAYYYCHHTHNRDESEPFLRCILGQLCRHMQSVPCSLIDRFRDDMAIGVEHILDAIAECLTELEVAYIVLDALDESSPCGILLNVIKTLTKEGRFAKLRLVATSRPEVTIMETLEAASTVICLTESEVREDIKRHVASTLQGEDFGWWPANLKSAVAHAVSYRASGMFRLANSQLDLLSRLATEAEIQRGLATLPETIYESYDRILAILSNEQRSVVLGILVMLQFFENNASMSSYCISILPRILAASTPNHKKTNSSVADYKTIRRWCGSLISVSATQRDASADPDDEESAQQDVCISHKSIFEYLDIYLERRKLTAKEDFGIGILQLCTTSHASQDHILLEELFFISGQFCSMVEDQAEVRAAYHRYLRSTLHSWLADLFDHKIINEEHFFSEVYMLMRKQILLRLLFLLWDRDHHLTIMKCRRAIGFSSLLETAMVWNKWEGQHINSSSFIFRKDPQTAMIMIHDGGASCGKYCYLRFKPKDAVWDGSHIATAMVCIDYEAIDEITKFPVPTHKWIHRWIGSWVVLLKKSSQFPRSSLDDLGSLLGRPEVGYEIILQIYRCLSSTAVLSETERKVWEDIGRLLVERSRLAAEGDYTLLDKPVSTDKPDREDCLDPIPYRTEDEMETLKRELGEYVDEIMDKLVASWV